MSKIATSAALAAALAVPGAAVADDFNATVVAGLPPTVLFVKMLPESFLPAIESGLAASGHTMTFNEQYGGAIASNGEEIEVVSAGLAELGYCIAALRASKLPLQNMTYYTPFVSSDVSDVAAVMNRLQFENKAMAGLWTDNNLVYLGGPIGIDDYALLSTKPVNSIDDLKGMKIATPGAALNWLSGTGAVAVSANLATYYNELKTGVYSGVVVSPSLAAPMKLNEVAPHVTIASLGANYIGGLCANKDWFDGLPEDVQKTLFQAADTAGAWYAKEIEAAYQRGLDKMTAAGATVAIAPEELRAAWAKGLDNAAKEWAKALDAQGMPGTETLAIYMNAMRESGAKPLRNWDQE
ncbi:MAG: C4-dicarboxylate ABC transporter permease [Hyphomicrobiales bacterium]|nr:MAG: C4-dicarboxylate ABC transporter permease [Hyphomicrobiales bacterium]